MKWAELFHKTPLYHLWHEAWIRYYFKFVLPRVREVTLDGVRLDVSTLSLKARNRLLNVGYERAERQFCLEFLRSEDAVLELGAAIGYLGLVCKKKIGVRRYAGCEANPMTTAVCERNWRLNGFEPQVMNAALATEDGQVELEVDSDFWEHSIRVPGRGGGGKIMDVPAITLGTLLSSLDFAPNVLIIDVEGAERFIDFGALPASIHKIIVEFHPPQLGPARLCELIGDLVGAGFSAAGEESGTFVFLRPEAYLKLKEARSGQLMPLAEA